MIKLSEIIYPALGLTEQEFHDHWRHPHAMLARQIRQICRYTRFHRIHSKKVEIETRGCVGVAEVSFDTEEAAAGLATNSAYLEHLLPDEARFCDCDKLFLAPCQEKVVRGFPEGSDVPLADSLWSDNFLPLCVKLLQFVSRKDADNWQCEDEAEIGLRLGAFRHILSHNTDKESSLIGIRELFWPTLTAFEHAVEKDPQDFAMLRAKQSGPHMLLAQGERII